MKKTVLLFLSFFFAFSVFAQKEAETLKKSRDLISNKKYASAFKVLQDYDPKDTKPNIFLLKEEIVLNYYVTSIMHQMFSLRDLSKNEKLEDYRGKENSSEMFNFAINEILAKLIQANPDNYKLHKGMGDFYYEVQQLYGDNWLKQEGNLFELMRYYYKNAIDHHEGNYLAYYVVGYANAAEEKYADAIPYFKQSIELKKDFADADYNLAYAYLFTNAPDTALKYAKNAFDLYTDSLYKGDASRMLGAIYTEIQDDSNAIKFYELSNSFEPGNNETTKPLLFEYIKTGNPKAKEMVTSVFLSDPEDPGVYNDLNAVFQTAKKTNELIEFYKSKIPDYKDQGTVLGNLNFFTAKLYLETDKKTAVEYFNKSKAAFLTVFEPDHEVFKAIDDELQEAGVKSEK